MELLEKNVVFEVRKFPDNGLFQRDGVPLHTSLCAHALLNNILSKIGLKSVGRQIGLLDLLILHYSTFF